MSGSVMAQDLSGIHWLAPTTVVASLLVGAAVAIGHHVFYKSLDGTVAQNDDLDVLGSSVSRQQLNTAGGTALAFLVKAALTTAVSTTYIQLFWRNLTNSSRQAPTLSTLNNLFGVFSNGFTLLKVWVWWRYPMLFCLAGTAWMIPIASIVTPATLSVVNVPVLPRNTAPLNVPNIAFLNLDYVASMNGPLFQQDANAFSNDSEQYYYAGPSRYVVDVVQAVSAGGEILTIDPPRANTSWELQFLGPALQCTNLTSPNRQHVLWNIANASGMNTEIPNSKCDPTGYVAWTGQRSLRNGSVPVAFPPQHSLSNLTSTGDFSSSTESLGPALDFYMAIMPYVMNIVLLGDTRHVLSCAEQGDPDPTAYFGDSTVVHCQLKNASYSVNFDYTGRRQRIRLVKLEYLDAQRPLARVNAAWGPPEDAAGKLAKPDCSILNGEGPHCSFDQPLVQTLSYQAILEAFTDNIFGRVHNEDVTVATFDTNVQNTPLLNTRELSFLTESLYGRSLFSAGSLQDAVLGSNGTLLQGLATNRSEYADVSIIDATEKLFSDTVISMISSKQLQPDPKSPFAPPATNVIFYDFHNVYFYSAAKLWIAYGLAILFTLLASIIGLVTLLLNHASFSTDFSSIVLFGRGASLSVQPHVEDLKGRDPLPRHLERARVRLSNDDPKQTETAEYIESGHAKSDGSSHLQRPLLEPSDTEKRLLTRHTL